jgi:hypothetical protein
MDAGVSWTDDSQLQSGYYVGYWSSKGIAKVVSITEDNLHYQVFHNSELTNWTYAKLGDDFFFDRDQAVAKAKKLQLEELSRLADEITRIAAIRF